jgi:hypothetical protein
VPQDRGQQESLLPAGDVGLLADAFVLAGAEREKASATPPPTIR